jgi:formylglycine-generating enzyme required for sulfatase activity
MARSPTPFGGYLSAALPARYRQWCGRVAARRRQALMLTGLLVVGSVLSEGLPVRAQEREQTAAEPRRREEEAARRRAAEAERNAAAARRTGEMVSVPGGAFYMGCNDTVDTECDEDEKPGRPIAVNDFTIDKTEVTVAHFGECVAAGACSSEGVTLPYWAGKPHPEWAWACNWGKSGRERHPLNCVEWEQARRYCAWAGKRLPTEAEWEKAARGTEGWKYPWGNRGYGAAGVVANIADETAKRSHPRWPMAEGYAEGYDDGYYGTAPVGSFPAGASPYGAVDMVGNVWEWTAEWYDPGHTSRAVRGGSCRDQPLNARASIRNWSDPGNRSMLQGFRCAQ